MHDNDHKNNYNEEDNEIEKADVSPNEEYDFSHEQRSPIIFTE